jgi:hypothetical protein
MTNLLRKWAVVDKTEEKRGQNLLMAFKFAADGGEKKKRMSLAVIGVNLMRRR